MAPSSLGAARVVALLASCALASAAVVGGTAKELQPTELASSAAADASGQAMHVSSIHSALSPYRELVHSLDNTDSTVSSDNTTNCLAEIIYDTIINNAVNFLENVSDSVGSTEKYMTMAILIGLIIVGLLLLLVGELFMRTTLVVSTSVVSFIFMLYLWNFILSNNDNDFVACTLPIIIAGACTALIVGTILCLMNKIISLTFFAFGAIIGVLAGFILRSVILASNPDIALNAYFDWYWLAIVGLAIAFGFLGVFLKHLMIFLVCAALGSWLVASSSIGLFDLFGVHTEAWVFYVILGGVGGLGILAHFFLIPKLRGSTSSDKDGQALEETFIRH